MPREPIPVRVAAFNPGRCRPGSYGVLVAVSSGYPPDRGRLLTCYAPLRRSPPCSIATPRAAPRLACVKPAASVHPEPGSNSPLFYLFHSLFLCLQQHGAPMPGFVSLTEGFRPLPYTSSFVSKRLLLHSLNVLLLAPREGADCKDRESFRDTQLRDAFFSKKIAGGGVAPRGRAPFPFCVCKGTYIAPDTQERRGLFSGRGDRPRRKMLCDTAL